MNKYQQYEAAKRALQSKGLTEREYEQELRKLARRLRL